MELKRRIEWMGNAAEGRSLAPRRVDHLCRERIAVGVPSPKLGNSMSTSIGMA